MTRVRSLALGGVVVYVSILLVLHNFLRIQNPDVIFQTSPDHNHGNDTSMRKYFVPNVLTDPVTSATTTTEAPVSIKPGTRIIRWSREQVLDEWYKMVNTIIPHNPRKYLNAVNASQLLLSRLQNETRHIRYPPFKFTIPNMASSDEIRLFLSNAENKNMARLQNVTEQLTGKINILTNAKALEVKDCGYKTVNGDFYFDGDADKSHEDSIVVPLLVPDSHAFQHFIDGLLPKLMQVLDVLLLTDAKLLMFNPRDGVIFEMLEEMHIPKEKIVLYSGKAMFFKKIINSCVTPPLHPILWNTARKLLRAPDILPPPNDTVVILLTRAGSHNGQRNMNNFEEVKKMLSLRYGSRFVVFPAGLNLDQARHLFGRAAILIGVHGGALYNLLYAPRTTHVIEIIPFTNEGLPLPGTAHQIFWFQGQLIGQQYWRMQLPPLNGNVEVPLPRLRTILDKVDMELKAKNS